MASAGKDSRSASERWHDAAEDAVHVERMGNHSPTAPQIQITPNTPRGERSDSPCNGTDDEKLIGKHGIDSSVSPLYHLPTDGMTVGTETRKDEQVEHVYLDPAQISDDDLTRAALHIDDGLKGRGHFGKVYSMCRGRTAQWCFRLVDSKWYRRFIYLIGLCYSLLVFAEPSQSDMEIRSIPFTPGSASPWILGITPLCLLILLFDVIIHIVFFTWTKFWKASETKWMKVECVLVMFFCFDFVILVVQEILMQRLVMPFRALRGVLFVCKSKTLQHVFNVFLSILVRLFKIFVGMFLFLYLFAAIGVHIFYDDYHYIGIANRTALFNEDYYGAKCQEGFSTTMYAGIFDNVARAILRLYVLLSTENFPDIMSPAYSRFKRSFFFFLPFLFFGVFFITATLLAFVIESYWVYSKEFIKAERKREREQIIKAWNILDQQGHVSLSVSDPRVMAVFRLLRPKDSDEHISELIDYIDENGDRYIDATEWTTRISDALGYSFKEESKMTTRRCVWYIDGFVAVMESKAMTYIVSGLLIVHLALFGVHYCRMRELQQLIVHAVRTAICSLFMMESIMRLIASSEWMRYSSDIIDLTFTLLAFIANVLWYFTPGYMSITDGRFYRGCLVTASSCLLVLRLAINSRQTKDAIIIFRNVAPIMFELMSLLLVLVYFYCVLGLELFYGFALPPEFSDSSAAVYSDCGLGFQSFRCSFLVMFQVITTSNWHEFMNAAILSTGTEWASLYFVSFHFIVVLIFMNLFVAIAIEAFNKLGIGREEGRQKAQEAKQPKNVADKAKEVISKLLSTGRDMERRHAHSDARKASGEVGDIVHHEADVPIEEAAEVVDESKLSASERINLRLKKRRKERKEHPTRIRVVEAFRKKQDGEIDLHVGDEVEVHERRGSYCRGTTSRGRTGWFPADKVVQVSRGRAATAAASELPNGLALFSPQAHLTDVVQQASQHRDKIGNQSGADWTRRLHGNMTVMNHDEMLELNKLFKSGHALKRSSSVPVPAGATFPPASIHTVPGTATAANTEVSSELRKPGKSRSKAVAFQLEPPKEEDEDAISDTSSVHLETVQEEDEVDAVDGGGVRKRKTSGPGEIPNWAANFAQTKGLTLAVSDAKDIPGSVSGDTSESNGGITSAQSQEREDNCGNTDASAPNMSEQSASSRRRAKSASKKS